MDPDNFDPQDPDEEPTYTSRTLTQGAQILIETLNESMFIGEVISLTIPGILIHQATTEITLEDLHSGASADDFKLSTPVEAFIPFASIHFIQSMQDLSEETLIEQLRADIDNYTSPPSESPSEETEPEPQAKPWEAFIHRLNDILKKFGV